LHSAIKPENLMWFTKEEREEKEKTLNLYGDDRDSNLNQGYV